MLPIDFWILFIAGAVGAFISDILKDNTLELPKIIDGKFCLGSIGSIIIGGIAGYYIDGSITTAFMGGFIGKSIIENLVPQSQKSLLEQANKIIEKKNTEPIKKNLSTQDIKDIIITTAKTYGVDEKLALKVAECESGFNPTAINVNTSGSKDRGLYQWNDKYHPEISDICAFDPQCATTKFCQAVKANNLSWWNASKKCWDK